MQSVARTADLLHARCGRALCVARMGRATGPMIEISREGVNDAARRRRGVDPGQGARMTCRGWAGIAAVLVAAIVPAGAQEWPTRPISMIVPYAAGGPPDVIARIIAPGMSESLGVQVVVENVSGAGGITGTARAARAAPDGYTFLLGAAGVLSQNQTLYKHPPYNSVTDFVPVGLIALTPAILVTRPNFPAKDLDEFTSYAKANQAKMLFGSGGAGSGGHIACLLLNTAIGVTVTHVPYRG